MSHFRKNNVFLLILAILHCKFVNCVVTKSELFPFLESTGSKRFIFDDDDYTETDLQKNFTFLGKSYSIAYINGNGLLTFDDGDSSHNFHCMPNASEHPAISVFMVDAVNQHTDESLSAKLLHRQDTTNQSLEKVSRDVFQAFPNSRGINLNWMLIVTWYNIPPLDSDHHDKRNTFQAILTTDGTQSFVLIYFNSITWPTSETGNMAQIGIYGGHENFNTFYLVPGSCTPALLHVTQMSNIDVPGKFVFRVVSKIELPTVSKSCQLVEKFKTNPSFSPRVDFSPRIVPALGLEPIFVHGLTSLCLQHTVKSIKCDFSGSADSNRLTTLGKLVPGNVAVVCPKPDFTFLGQVYVNVTVTFSNDDKITVRGFIYVLPEPVNGIDIMIKDSAETRELTLHAIWNKENIGISKINELTSLLPIPMNLTTDEMSQLVNVSILELHGNKWRKVFEFSDVFNHGYLSVGFPMDVAKNMLPSEETNTVLRALAISSTIHLEDDNKVATEVVSDVVKTTIAFAKIQTLNENGTNGYDLKCQRWFEKEKAPPNDVLACPDTLKQAENDWRFYLSTLSTTQGEMNPLNYTVYIQGTPSQSGAGSICAYNKNGSLVLGAPYGSRIHSYSPNSKHNIWNHYRQDIIPYLDCCLLSFNKVENCQRFFAKRTSYKLPVYQFPVPFGAAGAAQITPLYGKPHVLNSSGIFWLLKLTDNLSFQILVEKYSDLDKTVKARVITKAALAIWNTNSKFEVECDSSKGLLISLDDEPLNFYLNEITNETSILQENLILVHNIATVIINGTKEARILLQSGISVRFTTTAGNTSLDIIGSLPVSYVEATEGLLENSEIIKAKNYGDKWKVLDVDTYLFDPFSIDELSISDSEPFDKTTESGNSSNAKYYDSANYSFCNYSRTCKTDYQLTHNKEFAQSSAVSNVLLQTLLDAFYIQITRRKCQPPANLVNGHSLGQNYTVGSRVEYYCDSGYYLNSKNTSKDNKFSEALEVICAPNEFVFSRFSNNIINDALHNATWMVPDLDLPLDGLQLECVKADLERTHKITTIISSTSASILKPESVSSDSSSDMGVAILFVSTVTLWLVVFVLAYFIYRQRSSTFQNMNDTSEMHLLDFSNT